MSKDVTINIDPSPGVGHFRKYKNINLSLKISPIFFVPVPATFKTSEFMFVSHLQTLKCEIKIRRDIHSPNEVEESFTPHTVYCASQSIHQ
jgi:hypothetical protein